MGEGRTGEPQANHDRLTVAQAAARLGITEGAVRSRIKRGTLPISKDGGRVFVLWGSGTSQANQPPNIGVPADQSALIEALRDQIEDLRRERDDWKEQARMTDRLLSASMERIPPQLEAPQEASEAAETVEEAPERAEPHSAPGGAQEGTERPQARSGWRVPVDKLPWWHYVLGLFLVALAAYLSLLAAWMPMNVRNVVFLIVGLILLNVVCWSVPGAFGAWVGFRRTNPHLRSQIISFGVLVGLAFALGRFVAYVWLDRGALTIDAYFGGLIFGGVVIGWLLFVSGALIGSAWQRRRTGRISGTTPASPMAGATLTAPASRTEWTPRQQAILGFAGTVIAALIGLFQSVIAPIVTSLVGGG